MPVNFSGKESIVENNEIVDKLWPTNRDKGIRIGGGISWAGESLDGARRRAQGHDGCTKLGVHKVDAFV